MGICMDRSDFEELLAALYLRVNGYFASGFIAHAPVGNLTEIDVLAVRFPKHQEPEREIASCAYLHPPLSFPRKFVFQEVGYNLD